MMLPQLPVRLSWRNTVNMAMRGINFSDQISDGDIASSKGISTRRWPYIATRCGRTEDERFTDATAMTAWDRLITVSGGSLYYDGTSVGQVAPGEKQFAVVNTKLCIWPDKKILDLSTMTLKDMGAAAAGSSATFTSDTMTLNDSDVDFTALFRAGDVVRISGCSIHPENNKSVQIVSLTSSSITTTDNAFTPGTESAAGIGPEEVAFTEMNGMTVNLTGYPYCAVEGGELTLLGTPVTLNTGNIGGYAGYFYENDGEVYQVTRIDSAPDRTLPAGAELVDGGWVTFGAAIPRDTVDGETFTFYDKLLVRNGNVSAGGNGTTKSYRDERSFPQTPPAQFVGRYRIVTVDGFYDYLEYGWETYMTRQSATFAANAVITWYARPVSVPQSGGSGLRIGRDIPDMDFICESGNRLWGCRNEDQTIYGSALGDPTNFYTYQGLSTDSFSVAVGTEGKFTGCAKLGTSVLFWKENKLHKLLGSYPAEYAVYTYDMDGLQSGCEHSMAVINETLFYMGVRGVYAFGGGTPQNISPNFGEKRFHQAHAGTDGRRYYLSAADDSGTPYLLVYDTDIGIWTMEDNIKCTGFSRIGGDLYYIESGHVYLADNRMEADGIAWFAQFTPVYDTITGRKNYQKLLIRVQLPQGSAINAYVRCDGRAWIRVGTLRGKKEDVAVLPVLFDRGDKYEIRLDGVGPCTILGISTTTRFGSDG